MVGLLKVNEAHVERYFPPLRQFLKSTHYEQHVDGGSFRPDTAGFAAVTKVVGYDLKKHFACVREKLHPPVFIAVDSVRLLVEHLDGSVFSLLRDFPSIPHFDKKGMETFENDWLGGFIDLE